MHHKCKGFARTNQFMTGLGLAFRSATAIALMALAPALLAQDKTSASVPWSDEGAVATMDQALLWYNNREFSRAHTAFQVVAAKANQPTTATQAAEFYAIKCLFDMGDYDGFTSAASSLKASKPTHPALDDLAFCEVLIAEKRGDGARAAELLERFATAFPDSPYQPKVSTHLERALGMKGLKEALDQYHAQKDYEGAYDAFVAAVAVTPDPKSRAVAEYYAMRCLFELEWFDRFDAGIGQIRTANPDHPYLDELELLQAYTMEKRRDWNRAWELHEAFLKAHPSSQLSAKALEHLRALEPLAEPPIGVARETDREAEAGAYLAWMKRMKQEGEWTRVQAGATRLLKAHPSAPATAEALLLAAEAADEQDDTSASQAFIVHVLALPPSSALAARTARSSEAEMRIHESLRAAARADRGSRTAAAAILRDLTKKSPNHWQAPKARRVLSRLLLKDGQYAAAIELAGKAAQLEETPRFRDELLFTKASAQALSGDGASAKQVLDALVAQNDTGHYYTNHIVLTFERQMRDGEYDLVAQAADAFIPLYQTDARAWAAAMMYSAIARVQLGGTADLALAAQRFEKVWSECTADADFRNHTRASAAQWLIYLAKSSGDRDLAKSWYHRLRDEVPPSRVRTVIMRQCIEFAE